MRISSIRFKLVIGGIVLVLTASKFSMSSQHVKTSANRLLELASELQGVVNTFKF